MDTTLPPRTPQADTSDPRSEGRRAERERCRQIVMCPAAKGREIAARIIALETDLTAEAAIRLLASLAPDAAPAAATDKGVAASWDDIAASVSTKGSR